MEGNIFVSKNGVEVQLTQREMELCSYIRQGKRTKWIARELNRSPRTIDNQILRLREKIGANSRDEIVDFVFAKTEFIEKIEVGESPLSNGSNKKRIVFFFIFTVVLGFIFFISKEYRFLKKENTAVFEWNIPLERSFYIPRRDLFQSVSNKLNNLDRSDIVTIYGLAGVGKTTFAKNYLLKTKRSYRYKIWFNAETLSVLIQEILQLGEFNRLYDKSDKTDLKILKTLKWLEEKEGVIIVFDNVEDFSSIKKCIPRHCDILITSRNNKMPYSLKLDVMSPEEGETLFLEVFNKGLSPDFESKKNIRDILQSLGYLPLAIVQAASYVRENSIGISEYKAIFKNHLTHLLQSPIFHIQDHSPIYVSWNMSLDRISSKKTKKFLYYMSVLLPEKVDVDLATFLFQGSVLPEKKMKTIEMISILKKYSLISQDGKYIFMHRLFHEWLLSSMSKKNKEGILEEVAKNLSSLFQSPLVNIKNIEFISGLIPHTEKILEFLNDERLVKKSFMYQILLGLSKAYDLMGDYEKRKKYLDLAYNVSRTTFGEHSLEIASVYYSLGRFEIRAENFIRAESYLSLALKIYKNHKNVEATEVFLCLNELGRVYGRLAKYREAIDVQKRALDHSIALYGDRHIHTANVMNELGWVLYNYGDYPTAESYLRESIKLHEEHLGEDHIETARVLKSLGCVLISMRKLTDAEKILNRAYQIRKSHYGTSHIKVLNVRHSRAILYALQKKYNLSIGEINCCKKLVKSLYGDNLIFEAALNINLGNVYVLQGNKKMARKYITFGEELFSKNPSANDVNKRVARLSLILLGHKTDDISVQQSELEKEISEKHTFIKKLKGLEGDFFILNT